MPWRDISEAPEDGTEIKMRGVRAYRFGARPETRVVTGRYDTGGYTEGWVDDDGNEFWPDAWMPATELDVD